MQNKYICLLQVVQYSQEAYLHKDTKNDMPRKSQQSRGEYFSILFGRLPKIISGRLRLQQVILKEPVWSLRKSGFGLMLQYVVYFGPLVDGQVKQTNVFDNRQKRRTPVKTQNPCGRAMLIGIILWSNHVTSPLRTFTREKIFLGIFANMPVGWSILEFLWLLIFNIELLGASVVFLST